MFFILYRRRSTSWRTEPLPLWEAWEFSSQLTRFGIPFRMVTATRDLLGVRRDPVATAWIKALATISPGLASGSLAEHLS